MELLGKIFFCLVGVAKFQFRIAFKSPPGLHPDSYALKILKTILAEGKTSRLYKLLIDKGLANHIEADFPPFRDNGLFTIYAKLNPVTLS